MVRPNVLHFSLGPVQGWIGQARRTRDYWAGSFLLSWLSGHAMASLHGTYGTVALPDVETDPLFAAIAQRAGASDQVFVGTLPNRFRAVLSDDELKRFKNDRPCERAIATAWHRLTERVWEVFVAPVAAEGSDVAGIWRRQIGEAPADSGWSERWLGQVWEPQWVAGKPEPGEDDGVWLDLRKNWRTRTKLPESGSHCPMMSDYQELSGFSRQRNRDGQDRFWEALRTCVKETLYGGVAGADDEALDLLDVGRTERLCAPALVKRLFPVLPAEELEIALGWCPDGSRRTAGRLFSNARTWPSTAHIAAAPWMLQTLELVPDACRAFVAAVKGDRAREVAERDSRIQSLAGGDNDRLRRGFGRLDGMYFFDDMLEVDAREARLLGHDRRVTRRQKDAKALAELIAEVGMAVKDRPLRQRKFAQASPFYAMLAMDGDGAGKLMNEDRLGPALVTAGFGRFTGGIPDRQTGVREIVEDQHDGMLIYGGGDDVLAFLPIHRAIACAIALHRAYLAAFADDVTEDPELRNRMKHPARRDCPTISGGLVFAHHSVALSLVSRRALDLLDKTAKAANGRNSLALGVIKGSGEMDVWASGFQAWRPGDDDGLPPSWGQVDIGPRHQPVRALLSLIKAFADDPERSTSLLYNARVRLSELWGGAHPALDTNAEGDRAVLRQMLLAEWLRGLDAARDPDAARREGAKLQLLLDACLVTRHVRDPGSGEIRETRRAFDLAGAMIARFLADQGAWWSPGMAEGAS